MKTRSDVLAAIKAILDDPHEHDKDRLTALVWLLDHAATWPDAREQATVMLTDARGKRRELNA